MIDWCFSILAGMLNTIDHFILQDMCECMSGDSEFSEWWIAGPLDMCVCVTLGVGGSVMIVFPLL